MRHWMRTVTAGVMLGSIAMPAMAQSYGYGSQPSAYGPPPPPAYGPPPPAYGPPQQYQPPPPGSQCEASFERERRRPFICPMRVSKPVGAPCHCVAPPPAPGYAPGPSARGHVIP